MGTLVTTLGLAFVIAGSMWIGYSLTVRHKDVLLAHVNGEVVEMCKDKESNGAMLYYFCDKEANGE